MTKNHICAKDFLEIIVFFFGKFKEFRTNLIVSKQLKKSSDEEKSSFIKTFPEKLFKKSWMVLAFLETSP